MILTRQEKEQHILDLLEQGHNTREVAQETHTSFSYIGAVQRKAVKEKEMEQEHVQKASLSTQAYRLFLKGNNPVHVAIELNLREHEVDEYFKEYCKLEKLDNLYRMYQEITNDIEPFVELYKLMKDADMKPEQVTKLLSFANNGLVSLHFECNVLKTEVEYLKGQKEGLSKALENIKKNLEHYSSLCRKELTNLDQLSRQREKQENLLSNFETNNEYIKIKKFIEEKILGILSAGKPLLEYAVLSVIESIKKDTEKYRPLIDSKNVYDASYTYVQNYRNEYYHEASKTVLMEDADRLYKNIAKEEIEKIITYYSSASISQRHEEQAHVLQRQALTSQTKMYTEEYTFVHSEIEDD
jgi:hypothetical protein